MNRALMLAAELFDPFRTPADITFHDDGSFTESAWVTRAQVARARRDPDFAETWDRHRRAP